MSTAQELVPIETLEDECGVAKLSPTSLALIADFFKVLSETSRLQIVCVLRMGPKNVTGIIKATGLGQANVSKHLKILAHAGVVTRQQQGANVFYEIANPYVFQLCELVCDALAAQIDQQTNQFQQFAQIRQTINTG